MTAADRDLGVAAGAALTAPLPYRVDHADAVKIKDANGHSIAIMMQVALNLGRRDPNEVNATAAFIVRACNSYEAMRAALEPLAMAARAMVEVAQVNARHNGEHVRRIHEESAARWQKLHDDAAAALQLAKGK